MGHAEVEEVLENLRKELNDSIAATLIASSALPHFSTFLENEIASRTGPDSPVFVNDADDPGMEDDEANTPNAHWTLSETINNLSPQGYIDRRLSQQWIVSFYTAWEDKYRRELAHAHGLSCKNDIFAPLLGDLAVLRNCVVHHHGTIDNEKWKKLKVLGSWFQPGDSIQLRGAEFLQIEELFPWDVLANGPFRTNRHPGGTGRRQR